MHSPYATYINNLVLPNTNTNTRERERETRLRPIYHSQGINLSPSSCRNHLSHKFIEQHNDHNYNHLLIITNNLLRFEHPRTQTIVHADRITMCIYIAKCKFAHHKYNLSKFTLCWSLSFNKKTIIYMHLNSSISKELHNSTHTTIPKYIIIGSLHPEIQFTSFRGTCYSSNFNNCLFKTISIDMPETISSAP